MPEGGLTSASSLCCLPHKMASRNNLAEQESNAVLDEQVPGGTIILVNPQWIWSESEYMWTGELDLNTLWSYNVWTRIFSYTGRKSCRLTKYPDTCGRGLRQLIALLLHTVHCLHEDYFLISEVAKQYNFNMDKVRKSMRIQVLIDTCAMSHYNYRWTLDTTLYPSKGMQRHRTSCPALSIANLFWSHKLNPH